MEEEKKKEEKKTIRNIVRILNTDVPGNMSVIRALRKIKGVGFAFANAVCIQTEINPSTIVGEMSEGDIKKIESFIKTPTLPGWILNRQKDLEDGTTSHITGAALDLKQRENINRLRRLKAYKGTRHELGLPVRGQRTRSTFRKNKTVGVSRKKIQEKRGKK